LPEFAPASSSGHAHPQPFRCTTCCCAFAPYNCRRGSGHSGCGRPQSRSTTCWAVVALASDSGHAQSRDHHMCCCTPAPLAAGGIAAIKKRGWVPVLTLAVTPTLTLGRRRGDGHQKRGRAPVLTLTLPLTLGRR